MSRLPLPDLGPGSHHPFLRAPRREQGPGRCGGSHLEASGPAGAGRGGRRGPQPEAGPLPTPVPPAPRPAPPFMLRAPRLRRHVLDRAGGSRAPPDAGVPSAASQRRLLGVSTSLPGHGLAVSTCEVPATLSREYRFCPSNAWRVLRSVAALRVLSLSPGLPGTPRTAPDTFARCTDTVRALLQSARERGDGTMFVGVEAQCPSRPGIIQGVLTIRTSGSLSTHDRKSLRPRPGHGGPGRTCRARQQQHRPGELCADTRT